MGGRSFTPNLNATDEENRLREAEAAAAFDAAVLAAQERSVPPAGPPPPPGPGPRSRFLGGVPQGVLVPPDLPPPPPPAPPAPAPPEPQYSEDEANPELLARRQQIADETAPPDPNAPPPSQGQAPEQPQYGGGMRVIPGGMMPAGLDTKVHLGKPVPENIYQAYDAATGMQSQAGGIQRNADARFYEEEKRLAGLKMQAADHAALDHRKLAEEQDAVISARLNEIETLNKKAAGRPEDLWGSEVAFGRFLSFAFMAIGAAAGAGGNLAAGIPLMMGGKFVDGLINEDIQSKLDQREQAGKLAGRQINLLNLHNERLKDKGKAIDATKLAYYDSALAELDRVKAELGADANDAKYLTLQGQLLEERAKTQERLSAREAPDVAQEFSQRYQKPQFAGGGGGPARDIPNKVTLSDGTTYALDTENLQKESLAELRMRQEIQAKDLEALRIRQELSKLNPVTDKEKWDTGIGNLNTLQKEKMDAYSIASKQGVNTKSDVEREEKYGTGYVAGFGTVGSVAHNVGVPGATKYVQAERSAADAVIRRNIQRNDESQKSLMKTFNGEIVQKGFTRDPMTGELSRASRYTGQSVAPEEKLPPTGTKPMDPRVGFYPTRDPRPVRETAPKAPILGTRPTPPPQRGKK